jgi:hypothetical protein
MTTYQNNKAIQEVRSLKTRSIFHCETNQCHGFWTQTFRFYEIPSCVSYFLVGTLHVFTIPRRIHDPFPFIEVNGVNMNMKWKTFWIQGFIIVNINILFIGIGMMWTNSLRNQSKTYQMTWIKFTNFINNIWWDLSLKREVMLQMSVPWSSFIWIFIHNL